MLFCFEDGICELMRLRRVFVRKNVSSGEGFEKKIKEDLDEKS